MGSGGKKTLHRRGYALIRILITTTIGKDRMTKTLNEKGKNTRQGASTK